MQQPHHGLVLLSATSIQPEKLENYYDDNDDTDDIEDIVTHVDCNVRKSDGFTNQFRPPFYVVCQNWFLAVGALTGWVVGVRRSGEEGTVMLDRYFSVSWATTPTIGAYSLRIQPPP